MKETIKIVKTNNKFIIGAGLINKNTVEISVPFSISKDTNDNINIVPLDSDIIDTYIPKLTIKDYEYCIDAENAMADFYVELRDKFVSAIKERKNDQTKSKNDTVQGDDKLTK